MCVVFYLPITLMAMCIFFFFFSFQMKLYATYYRQERIVINDDYPIISVRDHKGGILDGGFRANRYISISLSVF